MEQQQAQATKQYIVWDRKEQRQVGGTYTNFKRALHRVDRLDNEYGAYRYNVRTVQA